METANRAVNKNQSDPKNSERRNLFLILIMAVLGLLTIFVETMLVPALPYIAEQLAASP